MIYKSKDALPENVKKMPPAAADVWMNAFNGAAGENKSDVECAAAADLAVEKAGYRKDANGNWNAMTAKEFVDGTLAIVKVIFPFLQIDTDPEKAAVQIREAFANGGDLEVEIFSVGQWNGDDYTIDDLHDMVKNFKLLKSDIKPPVKLGHNDDGLNKIVSDGQPAYGWVKELRVVGDKLMAIITQVPEVLKKAIKAGRYKRVSSEIYWNLKKKSGELYRRVLGAVAFLGADAPAVTNLADLQALFSRSTGTAEPGSFEGVRLYTFKTEDGEHLTQERRSSNMLTEDQIRQIEDENTRLKASNDVLIQKNLSERKRRASDQVKTYCDAQVKAGLMQPSTRDTIMTGIKTDKYMYSDEGDGSFAIPFHMFRTVYDVRRPGAAPKTRDEQRGRVDMSAEERDEIDGDEQDEHEYTNENATAQQVVHAKVQKYCSEKKVDYSTGLRSVLQANPKLARAYVESTPLVKHESEGSSASDADSE